METIFYTKITYKAISRNDNWKYGGNATTFMSDSILGKPIFEVNQFGKTKEEAENKLILFLSDNGKTIIQNIGSF